MDLIELQGISSSDWGIFFYGIVHFFFLSVLIKAGNLDLPKTPDRHVYTAIRYIYYVLFCTPLFSPFVNDSAAVPSTSPQESPQTFLSQSESLLLYGQLPYWWCHSSMMSWVLFFLMLMVVISRSCDREYIDKWTEQEQFPKKRIRNHPH